MVRLAFWTLALSFVVLVIFTHPLIKGVAGLLLGKPQDSVWYISDASLRGLDEHRVLADDLFANALEQVPNYSSMPSPPPPMPSVGVGGGGLVLETISYRNRSKSTGDALMSFLYFYLPVDPGDTVAMARFFKGRSADDAVLLAGYVNRETGQFTFVFPLSGQVRVERVAPDRIRVAYASFKYECASYVGGNGKPKGWLANLDCPQNLFPRSIQYGPKPPDAP